MKYFSKYKPTAMLENVYSVDGKILALIVYLVHLLCEVEFEQHAVRFQLTSIKIVNSIFLDVSPPLIL